MEDKSGLVLKLQPGSKTGYLGVIEVKGKFQGRLQVKGDGRGGLQKRRQVAIPGLFDTAKEAAEMLAILEKAGPENLWPGGIYGVSYSMVSQEFNRPPPMAGGGQAAAGAAGPTSALTLVSRNGGCDRIPASHAFSCLSGRYRAFDLE